MKGVDLPNGHRISLDSDLVADLRATLAVFTLDLRRRQVGAVAADLGVAGNTVRGIHRDGNSTRPIDICRSLVTSTSAQVIRHPPQTEQQVRIIFDDYCRSVGVAFLAQGYKDLGFGQRAKLATLFLKYMAFHRDLHPSARDLLIKVAPVSLDEHVLTVLRRAGPFAIPRRVSMGWVKTQKMFAALQAAVRMHTLEAKVPNLCFDYLGWDLKGRTPTAGIA